MRVTYGIEIVNTNDAYITTAEQAMNAIIETAVPGTFMVDNLPIRMIDISMRYARRTD